MSNLPYDATSANSILAYSMGLSGKSLFEAAGLSDDVVENLSNKGHLGQMVERYYFKVTPLNTPHEPDFPEAGVELKTTGVLKDKSGQYKAKERLVLTNINFELLPAESWSSSSMMHKCHQMLILFYEYQKELAIYNRRFVYEPILWSFPEADLILIKKDWETIWSKVRDGKAHELSEGDTFYLGACRKGTGGSKETLKKQFGTDVLAKSRAFSLKPSYVNTIISGHAIPSVLIKDASDAQQGIESVVHAKLKPYEGKTIEELSAAFDFHRQGKTDKGFSKALAMRMLGTTKRAIPELEKAGVEPKILTLQMNGSPKEYLPFPTFDYMKIPTEQWEDSTFSNKLEQKFLFLVFKSGKDGKVRFYKGIFWNMPYSDRLEAKKVWEATKRQVVNHKAEELPKISDSPVAHVRPHGADNTTSLFPTPQGDMLPRKGFWLNKKYIAKQIASADF